MKEVIIKIINIRTKVYGTPRGILAKFTLELLLKLTPPLINVEVNQFDGNKKNSEVHIISSLFGNYQNWKNLITEDFESDDECYFVDEAIEMPFPFTSWIHTHKIRRIDEKRSYIQDHIKYSCQYKFLESIIYPAIFALMYYRKPIYIDTFNEHT